MKTSLKFTLPALLLMASASAFAAEQADVTLNDGTTTSWSEFVKAINDPSTANIMGDSIPKTDPIYVAYVNANTKVEQLTKTMGEKETAKNDAEEALGTANEELEAAKQKKAEQEGLVKDKTDELGIANKGVTDAQKAVDDYDAEKITGPNGAQTLLDQAEAQLASWNTQMTELNNTITQLTGESTTLTGKIDDANEELKALQKQYDALGKEVTQKTTTTYLGFFDGLMSAAQTYNTGWSNYYNKSVSQAAKFDQDLTIYYIFEDLGDGSLAAILAFSKPDNFSDASLGWKEATKLSLFKTALNGQTGPFISVDVYVGEENYPDGWGYIHVMDDVASKLTMVQNAVAGLQKTAADEGYSKTTVTTETTYEDPDKEKELRDAITDKETEISGYRADRTTVNGKITTARTSMTNLQKQIDDYTKVPEGAAEGTVSKQQKLKNDLEYAKTTGRKAVNDALEAAKKKVETVQGELAAAKEAVSNAVSQVTIATTAASAAKTDYTNAVAAYESAQQSYNDAVAAAAVAKANLDAAQAKANEAAFAQVYNNVALEGDVTADTAIKSYAGNFNGNGHIITLQGITDLFTSFDGTLTDVAVNNGRFYSVKGTNAKLGTAAYWNGTQGVYVDANQKSTESSDLGQLGFVARDTKFGVDLKNKAFVAAKDAVSPVYSITTYRAKETPASCYAQLTADDTFITYMNPTGFKVEANHFVKSETTDLDQIPNVFYPDGTCKNVVVEDKSTFFCPQDINAEKVQFTREFTAGQNTVCVPFELSKDIDSHITAVSSYDRETPDKFYFTVVEGVIPANTPAILVADADFTMPVLTDVQLKATPDAQKVADEGATDDPSVSYGTFKKMGRGEFAGESQNYKVYGLSTKDWKFHPAGENATFPAFRMVIYSDQTTRDNVAPRRIAFRNEFGDDITDEIESSIKGVSAASSELSVVGGKGEIIITAEANQGEVAIYGVDGKLIEVADVTEGTTTVKVQTGVYVVLGKKVMVK